MTFSLILDVLVALLLVVTIGFAVVLNKRLAKLRADREALEKLATTFGDSTYRAEEGIKTLQHTTDVLQQRLDQAQNLKDDLAFLIERGDKAADNLEYLVRATRDVSDGASRAQPAPEPKPEPAPEAKSEPAPEPTREPLKAERDEILDQANTPDGLSDDDGKSEAERELLKAIRSAG